MALAPSEVLPALAAQRVVPVVRAGSAKDALDVCERLLGAGLGVIEVVTTTIPDWPSVVAGLVAHDQATAIGVGTVTNPADADRACGLGAAFLVSPYPAPSARAVADANGTPFVGGGLSPGEIAAESVHGVCKLFPAHVGGIAYLTTLRAILPSSRIMPTGGIPASQVGGWLAAGAYAVGVGSDLYAAPDLDATLAALGSELSRAS